VVSDQRAKPTVISPPPPKRPKDLKWTNLDGGRPITPESGYSLSSEHTVLAFTPPYEQYPNPSPPAPTRHTARKSLPWLGQRPFESRASTDLKVSQEMPDFKPLEFDIPSSLYVNLEPSFPTTSLYRYAMAESPAPATITTTPRPRTIQTELSIIHGLSPTNVLLTTSPKTIVIVEDISELTPEPTKRPPPTRMRVDPELAKAHIEKKNSRYMRKKAQTPLPPIPVVLPETPADKAIIRGLHVATAAAYDEEVDMWIQTATGYRIRELLSGLGAFDGLGRRVGNRDS
jgi:hypothetical protein